MSRTTPGPWEIVKCNCGHRSCHTYGLSSGNFYQGCGFDLEDARLASAAPEMYGVLQELINLCAIGDVDETTEAYGWGEAIKKAKAAIAKVEGRDP